MIFERYSEQARRTVFFARIEASNFGSNQIELEHLLLGVLRDLRLVSRVLPSGVEQLRARVEAYTPRRKTIIPGSCDIPLSNECKSALDDAAEEAKRLGSVAIGNEHLLGAILRQKDSYAARVLREYEVRVEPAGPSQK